MDAPFIEHILASTKQTQEKGEEYPSTYSYDEASGFYYDSATGLYYDPNTQYHYNSDTGLYCYYDATKKTYVSVDTDGSVIPSDPQQPSAVPTTTTTTDNAAAKTLASKAKKTDPSNKPLSAKKIAKDMERWAKNVNAAKSVQQQHIQTVIQQERIEAVSEMMMSSATPMASTEVKRSGVPLSAALLVTDERASLSSHMVEAVDVAPPSHRVPPEADANPVHTDWDQLACLLCKRKFPSKEVLIKHQQFSDLHKQNLMKKCVPTASIGGLPTESEEIKYRDRAKERRDKFGTPVVTPGWKKRLERELVKDQPVHFEEPTKEGIKQDNVGNRMLQAMGWSEGEGLGKAKQGIVEPIKAERRTAASGLGSAGSKYATLYSSGGSYRDTLKQLTKARFEDAYKLQ